MEIKKTDYHIAYSFEVEYKSENYTAIVIDGMGGVVFDENNAYCDHELGVRIINKITTEIKKQQTNDRQSST